MPRSPYRAAVLMAAVSGCVSIAEVEHCELPALPEPAASVTWHADVRPIIESRCATCHRPGDIAPFDLTNYDEVFALRAGVKNAVMTRSMPPWQPAPCCNRFRDDFSLSESQIALIGAWVDQGGPEGDPADYPGAPPTVGGLSRVDVEVRMPQPYRPQPKPGRIDDFRCFAVDWPLDEPAYVTGINPVPGARSVLHHVIVAYAEGDAAKAWENLDSEDGRPGIPCEGGLADLEFTGVLGGSLFGSDFPSGLGTRIEPGTKIILDVHYSLTSEAPPEDQTSIQMKIEPIEAPIAAAETLILANPAWLVSDAFLIEAGAEAKRYRFQYDPRVYTKSKPVLLRGFTPHMHEFGTQLIASVVRKDGRVECLADIQGWEFGWEQPYWFEDPIRLEVGDELYIECTFDNSADNQPIIDGRRIEPRDIAWGTDQQDMCAGFITFTPLEDE